MSTYVLARQLKGKEIITNEGEDIGRVADLSIDEISGRIEELVLDVNIDSPFSESLRSEDGYAYCPFDAVLSIGDYIIVEHKAIGNLSSVPKSRYSIARQLAGKKVITNEGEDLGNVLDLSINEYNGKIEDLIIDPSPDSPIAESLKSEDGYSYCTYDAVLSVGRRYILVEKRALIEGNS